MQANANEHIGFACAYTPLALIDAAGFVPFRILPVGDAPDQAGSLLHDNMCPHVKRVLDRALAEELPDLAGLVLMNSCDAMRRLADAWRAARPDDRITLVDLPPECSDASVAYLRGELSRCLDTLSQWAGGDVTEHAVAASIERYNELAAGLARLVDLAGRGKLPGGRRALQDVSNRSVTGAVGETLALIERLEGDSESSRPDGSRVPVLLFGNVLPDPEAFELFESCGCRIVADDLCTGSRQLVPIELEGLGDLLLDYARAILSRPACARTIDASRPGGLAEQVLARAKDCGAKGVIVHVMKFCDPYLARLPRVQQTLREAGLPVLVLEGDCSLRSLGQHRTRIEAFVEMLVG